VNHGPIIAKTHEVVSEKKPAVEAMQMISQRRHKLLFC